MCVPPAVLTRTLLRLKNNISKKLLDDLNINVEDELYSFEKTLVLQNNTLENENGEERQVQGCRKHGSALKKGGKGKKTYAYLPKEEKQIVDEMGGKRFSRAYCSRAGEWGDNAA